jgi:hypothetical protein
MKRPPFTMKTLENLEDLVHFARCKHFGLSDDLAILNGRAKPAQEAIEWISEMRRWKTWQNEKPIEIPVPPGNPSD